MLGSRQRAIRRGAAVLTLIALPLLIGCNVNPFADETAPMDDGVGLGGGGASLSFAFETHVVIYSGNFLDSNQLFLDHIDSAILSTRNFHHIDERHLDKAVLYFDMWGKNRHLDSDEYTIWQPAPGELGEEDVVMNGGVHCYRFDDAHVVRFLGWIESFLEEHGHEVRGVFLDDFGYDRDWWSGSDENRDLIWGPMDGKPGWREIESGWNLERVQAIESGALHLVRQYCGPSGVLIVNGPARALSGVRRFAENVGSPNNERWERLEVEGVDEWRYARAGDMLQVNGVAASGIWGDWTDTSSGNGWDNLLRSCNLAAERGLSVGLAYGEMPLDSSTIYSLYWDPSTPGAEWPGFIIQDD